MTKYPVILSPLRQADGSVFKRCALRVFFSQGFGVDPGRSFCSLLLGRLRRRVEPKKEVER